MLVRFHGHSGRKALATLWLWAVVAHAASPAPYGNYLVDSDHVIGVDQFVTDDRQEALLFSDYRTGVVRRLFPVGVDEFEMGPGFAVQSPVELNVRFDRDAKAVIRGVFLRSAGGEERYAVRMPVRESPVEFNSDSARLAGTLMIPDSPGPHPSIVLLHGSGPLTRHSFGPYPHFFTSLGFAVLIYDKRGTGESTGLRLDTSTGVPPTVPDEYFPAGLASDVNAAVRFLRSRPEIDPGKIGLWGSSEGGMLTTQIAARDDRIAFVINSSGFMGPLHEVTSYQAGNSLRRSGFTEEQIAEVKAVTRQWVEAARTGQGLGQVLKRRAEALQANQGWLVGWTRLDITTPEQLRWYWEHVMSFDPLPLLATVRCPVLGLFGEVDTSTDAAGAAASMRSVLAAAGHGDFTVKVLPGAGHSLALQPGGERMAPEVFPTLRDWLHDRFPSPR